MVSAVEIVRFGLFVGRRHEPGNTIADRWVKPAKLDEPAPFHDRLGSQPSIPLPVRRKSQDGDVANDDTAGRLRYVRAAPAQHIVSGPYCTSLSQDPRASTGRTCNKTAARLNYSGASSKQQAASSQFRRRTTATTSACPSPSN